MEERRAAKKKREDRPVSKKCFKNRMTRGKGRRGDQLGFVTKRQDVWERRFWASLCFFRFGVVPSGLIAADSTLDVTRDKGGNGSLL